MEVKVFGMKGIKGPIELIQECLRELGLEKKVKITFFDKDTARGLAEATEEGVFCVPTVIIRTREEKVAQWDDETPTKRDLLKALRSLRTQEITQA